MPHQCTDCGRGFDDGSKAMLSGCPDCGGNTFQFMPSTAETDPERPPEPAEPPQPDFDSSVARTVGTAATTVRDWVSSGGSDPESVTSPDSGSSRGEMAPATGSTHGEDEAQASARSELVDPDHLPDSTVRDRPSPGREVPPRASDVTPSARTTVSPGPVPAETEAETQTEGKPSDGTADRSTDDESGPDSDERPGLDDLRAELNQQFESIRVLEPGHYELNLMELYDREEYIIALQEDGKYTIQVPERWSDDT